MSNDAIERFTAATADLRAARRERLGLRDAALLALVEDLNAWTRTVRPRSRPRERRPDEALEAFAVNVRDLARRIDAGEVDRLVALRGDRLAAEERALADRIAADLAEVDVVALDVAIPGDGNIRIAKDGFDAGHGTQTDARGYARYPVALAEAVLDRRGYRTLLVRLERPGGWRLLSDAPPDVGLLLRRWRLDEATQIEVSKRNGGVNWRVYGLPESWWDLERRGDFETRDASTFEAVRRSEDLCRAANGLGPFGG